jgi:nucleoside triphosphatase
MEEKPRLAIGALILNQDGEILLLKSHKWQGRYVVPCGHVEFMERLEDAVRREVGEETGLEVEDIRFLQHLEFINPQYYYKKGLHFVGLQYTCRALGKEVRLNDEAEAYLWAKPREALNLNLGPGTRSTLEYFLSST